MSMKGKGEDKVFFGLQGGVQQREHEVICRRMRYHRVVGTLSSSFRLLAMIQELPYAEHTAVGGWNCLQRA
jgi:hypothetical protein